MKACRIVHARMNCSVWFFTDIFLQFFHVYDYQVIEPLLFVQYGINLHLCVLKSSNCARSNGLTKV